MTIEASLPKFELNATVYVKRDGERLLRRLQLRGIEYEGEVSAVVSSATETIASLIIQICPGVPADIFVPEPTAPTQIKVTLSADMFFDYNLELYLKPARPWRIHIVQLSHHDLGCTSLPQWYNKNTVTGWNKLSSFVKKAPPIPKPRAFGL